MKKSLICGIILAATFLMAWNDAIAGYNSTLRRWTKGGRAFTLESMDARLIWKATMLSDEIFLAQASLKEDKMKTVFSHEVAGNEVKFFLSLYTHNDLKDFSMDDSSAWKIYLLGADGREVGANKIENVTITPTEKVFYPYLNRWSRAYLVTFPNIDIGHRPELIMRSMVAESRLRWKLK